jgi:uncharacterized protein (TIGR00369 family)
MPIPDGFQPHTRKSPLTEPWEPLFAKVLSDRLILGAEIRDAHCNSRGLVHGGFIAALADNAMGLSCMTVLKARPDNTIASLVTVSLQVDYLGQAKIGQWLEIDTHYMKTGRTLSFANAFITADREVIAKSAATFRAV